MGLFDNFSLKEGLGRVAQNALNAYKRQLPQMSDEVILRKLETTSDEAYEATYREARRRGIV